MVYPAIGAMAQKKSKNIVLTYNGKNSPTLTHNSVVRKWWDELPT